MIKIAKLDTYFRPKRPKQQKKTYPLGLHLTIIAYIKGYPFEPFSRGGQTVILVSQHRRADKANNSHFTIT